MADIDVVLAVGLGTLSSVFTVGYFSSAVALMPTYLFPTIGEIYAEHSGVMNIGIEGIMVLGAFLGFYGHYETGSATVGFALAALGGMALALLVAYLCVTLLLDQIVVGLGIFLLGSGLASYASTLIYPGGTPDRLPNQLQQMPIPLLEDVPALGSVFFDQNVLVYIALALGLLSYLVLYRTKLGREIRATGEDPSVADSLGVDVYKVRYITVVLGGAFAGIGGAYLAQVVAGRFSRLIVGGRGFIVIGIVIVSVWGPRRAMAVVFLFALLDSFGSRIQLVFSGAPITLIAAIPFVATIVMLLIIRGFEFTEQRMPGALTENYRRQSE